MLFACLWIGNASAENSAAGHLIIDRTIAGRVTDDKGEGLPSVSIVIKGTQRGTTSDLDGKYSLNVPDGPATLTFSFVGFASQEVAIGNQSAIDVTMKTDQKALDEVIVVGYNSQSKRNIISAVTTISGETINKRIATDPVNLLQGQLPGLQVIQNSGEPGNEGTQLRIRGTGTFSGAGNDPLVIVDGLPGNLSIINPNNINP